MKKLTHVFILAASLVVSASMQSLAGNWIPDGNSWKWKQDDNTFISNGWHWLDGNHDGRAECYFFENDHLLTSTTTPDGYEVDYNGAWTENGILQVKYLSPSAEIAAQESARALYTAASEKAASLTDQAVRAKMQMRMALLGENLDMNYDMDIKIKDCLKKSMILSIKSNINMLNQTLQQEIFYKDGYYYTNVNGDKIKMKMDLNSASILAQQQTQASTLYTMLLKDVTSQTDEHGNTILSYTSDAAGYSDYINQIYQTLGLNAKDQSITTDIKSISGVTTISPSGYILSDSITMDMNLDLMGESTSISLVCDTNYINPGQPVEISLPSDLDSYQEYLTDINQFHSVS